MNSIQNSFIETTSHSFLLPSAPFREAYPKVQNSQMSLINEKKIGEVWSKHNFDTNKVKVENVMNINSVQAVWGAARRGSADQGSKCGPEGVDYADKRCFIVNEEAPPCAEIDLFKGDQVDDIPQNLEQSLPDQEETSPSHHARRPPNAFLIFCKKHRPIVRQRYPTTENRGVTKILGEWWALLGAAEKQPYNDLAKEYKDAFLIANPNFRWYKLPAPPLRTLTTRPTTISKPPATISSPPPTTLLSEFTPGKLADESQLGGLTSLMNNNYSSSKKEDTFCCKVEDNNNENPSSHDTLQHMKISDKMDEIFSSPTNLIKLSQPPKPIKKRVYEHHDEEKSCSKKIFDESNITQQDLLNKVVDDMFANDKDEPKEQRKSDRMCKGKRYERFMVESKLLGNKRDTKLTQHNRCSHIDTKIEQELTLTKPSLPDAPKFDLENTIKRLAKRTNMKINFENDETKPKTDTSESGVLKSPSISINLDLRIDDLPSLNYDDFVKRKRESKKRKPKMKSDSGHNKIQRVENNNKPQAPPAVGSKKRKNKRSITHLNKNEEAEGTLESGHALLGLETLAMVAASTEKIGEKVTT